MLFTSLEFDLRGRVVDTAGSPVPYATLQVADRYTVANAQGEFVFKDLRDSGTLHVSCMGFTLHAEAYSRDAQQPVEIMLTATTLELEEVTVTPLDARELMGAVIDKLADPNLYGALAVRYEFGLLEQVDTQDTVFLREQLLLMDRIDRGRRRPAGYRFLTAREDTSRWDSDQAAPLYGPKALNRSLDFFTNASTVPDFLDELRFQNFTYELEEEDQEKYVIAFKAKKRSGEYDGELWVQKADTTVQYLRYAQSPTSLRGENLRLVALAKLTPLKYVKSQKRQVEAWTDQDAAGRYFVKALKMHIQNFQELKRGPTVAYDVQTKMQAVAFLEEKVDAQSTYTANEIWENAHSIADLPAFRLYRFNLLFDSFLE
ncbi:MAG: carboxypeptidase-like regulatory domain-containing protein [Nitritalea sp.]